MSFAIGSGEYVAVMGPSGSGKSTLMHILGCLDVPTSGAFWLAGEDVSAMSEDQLAHVRNRRIGFVFQQFNLLASLSAWRNVELPLVYAGVDRATRRQRSLAALDRVGLGDRIEHRPGELSGGQQQRVAVARALVTDPDLILADEPTGNLDSVSARDVLDLLEELHQGGRTIVLITHDADVAGEAERTMRIRDGLIFEGEPAGARGGHVVNVLETFRTGLEAVVTHRLRSGLTVLGIMIGITAVILTVGLGEGAQQQVSSEITALGSNLLTVSPGSTTSSSGIRGGFGSASTLTVGDAAALASKTVAPDIAAVAPTTSSSETLVAGTTNWTATVVGTDPSWLTVRGRSMTEGRFIAGHDLDTRADVVVLGSTTAEELFGRRDAVGQSVNVNGVPMSVIGVLNTVGSSGSSSTASDQDDQAILPITTASTQVFGGTSRNSVSDILLQATSSSTLSAAYQEANAELLSLHAITTPTDADYTITPEQSLVSTATSVDRTLTVLLGGIAGISLLVGGIGVMNIMLVSVTERIREIGLRKALGATPRAIRRQFLIEASVLGLLGGVLGVGLGLLGAWILPHFISDPITISAAATAGAIVVAIGIGVAFGVYPAGRAAKLPPIDALRSE